MKKANLLSRAEMKKVMGGIVDGGGIDGGGTCTVKVKCNKGAEISCSGSAGACKYENVNPWGYGGWVQCDKDPKVACA